MKRRKLLGTASAKTSKGEKLNYLTGILYLAPHKIAGFNVCPHASIGCAAACLYNAGRGKFTNVQLARISKTKYFRESPTEFMLNIVKDIDALIRKAKREGMTPCVRLNGTSDLPFIEMKFNGMRITDLFPDVQFYDYSPNYKRMIQYLNGGLPSNYHLTFSRKEDNEEQVESVLSQGGNVAIVFEELPKTWKGYKVIDADKHDLRFLDDTNVVCGLTFKGTKADKLKAIESGFLIPSK